MVPPDMDRIVFFSCGVLILCLAGANVAAPTYPGFLGHEASAITPLGWLVSPTDLDIFWADHYGQPQEAYHIERRNNNFYHHLLNQNDINALTTKYSHLFQCLKDGELITADRQQSARLRSLDSYHRPAHDLRWSLESQMNYIFHLSLLVLHDSTSVAPHWDAEDLFLLQAHGRSTLNIYGAYQQLASKADDLFRSEEEIQAAVQYRIDKYEPRQVELAQGDAIFVPRGVIYSISKINLDGRSDVGCALIEVSMDVSPYVWGWGGALQETINRAYNQTQVEPWARETRLDIIKAELISQLFYLSNDTLSFRTPIPPGWIRDNIKGEEEGFYGLLAAKKTLNRLLHMRDLRSQTTKVEIAGTLGQLDVSDILQDMEDRFFAEAARFPHFEPTAISDGAEFEDLWLERRFVFETVIERNRDNDYEIVWTGESIHSSSPCIRPLLKTARPTQTRFMSEECRQIARKMLEMGILKLATAPGHDTAVDDEWEDLWVSDDAENTDEEDARLQEAFADE